MDKTAYKVSSFFFVENNCVYGLLCDVYGCAKNVKTTGGGHWERGPDLLYKLGDELSLTFPWDTVRPKTLRMGTNSCEE